MSFEFRAAVRSLLLPVASAQEAQFLEAASAELTAAGIAEDQSSWIYVQLRRWKSEGRPQAIFAGFLKRILYDQNRVPPTFIFENLDGPNGERYLESSRSFAQNYFSTHEALVVRHLLSHDAARQILSHSGMLIRLAIEEGMTASEISRLVSIRDHRFSLNWRGVRAILSAAKQAPILAVDRAQEIYREDAIAEPILLGDLSVIGAIARIGQIAENLGCIGDFSLWLKDLLIDDLHPPYLLLLHYQLLIQGEFDHAVTYAYEFSPRGQLGDWLTDCYIDAGVPVAKSAFLNNAKATLRFDSVWVSGRVDHLRSATALAKILGAMENLASLAKDELAAQMRGLLHRYMRLTFEANLGELPNLIPALDTPQVANLLIGIGAQNTQTTGILEQRLTDCIGLKRHSVDEFWTSRGVGDSVFAANTFRKKFGDAEFELADRNAPQIHSYEAHGGRLTTPYFEDHLDSFSTVLKMRADELQSIADLENWAFSITFVAHSFEANLPAAAEVSGLQVQFEYLTFAQVANELDPVADAGLVDEHLISKLNEKFVHPNVRIAALELADPA